MTTNTPEQITADHADQFDEFNRLLDAPLPSTTKFEKLFARPSVFSDDDA